MTQQDGAKDAQINEVIVGTIVLIADRRPVQGMADRFPLPAGLAKDVLL
ncbi:MULTISPECIES: hypothetical protein [unclassified Streptomyces]|nr:MULTISPECIES: hypothetical protein [unclassified Streptomyces]